MTTATTTATTVSLPHPIIILGRDDSGKAHASFFPATDAQPASRAASLMGMLAIKADTDAVRSLLPRLPKGKLFDSGKAFVPFVKQALYDQIVAQLPEANRATAQEIRVAPADEAHVPILPNNLPEDWSKVVVGSLVLALDSPSDCWYEATVIEAKPENVFRLRWRHYLDELPFTRKLEDLALLHPSASNR